MKKPSLRSELAIVRGLGSAKEGTGHFITQRVTALLLAPLTLWFIYSFMNVVTDASAAALAHWLASGFHAAFLILLLLALFMHAKIGIQVIIEDYVHCPYLKMASLLINATVMWILAIVSVLAVVKLNIHPMPLQITSHIITH